MDEEQRTGAMLTFWSVYCLDRRWSFGTGMPFALQDSDIDPNVPKPVSRDPFGLMWPKLNRFAG